MTAFTLKRVAGRVVLSPTPVSTVDIVYMGDLDPAGVVSDSDETFWTTDPPAVEGVALKRVTAAQVASYVIAKGGLSGGGGGVGTVTSITTTGGVASSPNPITGAGSIYLANTGVIPGSYINATISVDNTGRILSASSGTGGSATVTLTGDVTGTGTGSVGTTVVRLQTRPVSSTAPLDSQVLAWSNLAGAWQPTAPVTGGGGGAPPGGTSGQVQINVGGTSFGGISMVPGDANWNTTTGVFTLVNTAVTPGTYQGIQFDSKGRAIAASNQNYVTGGPYLPLAGGTIAGVTPGVLYVNRSGGAMPAVPTGLTPILWSVGASGENVSVTLDGIGAGPNITMRRTGVTSALPVNFGDGIGTLAARGRGASGYGSVATARITFGARQTFTDANQGTDCQFWTTPLNSTTAAMNAIIGDGLVVGPATGGASGDMGIGTVNVSNGFFVNGAAVSGGSGSGVVASSSQFQMAYYDTVGSNARVAGHSFVTTSAAGSLTINRTGGAMPASPPGLAPVLWSAGLSGEVPSIVLDAIAAGPNITMRRTGVGGPTSPVNGGEAIGTIGVRGYGPAGYIAASSARIVFTATETWTGTGQGTQIEFVTTAPGTTTPITSTAVLNRGLVVGSPAGGTAGDMGLGTINAQNIYVGGIAVTAGGGTPPGGGNTQVQYNFAGNFGGSTGATFNGTQLTSLNVGLGTDGTGDVWYRAATGLMTRLGLGTAGFVLTAGASAPTWAANPASGLSGMAANQVPIANSATTINASLATTGTANVTRIASSTAAAKTSGNLAVWNLDGNLIDGGQEHTGTVTSVQLSVPGTIFSVPTGPIVGSGTISIAVAGNSGGIPFFNTTSTMGTTATLTNHGVIVGQGAGAAPIALGAGTSGSVLTSGGVAADPFWQPLTAGSGTVVSSPAGQIPWYPSLAASVQGHASLTVTAGGAMTINGNTAATPPALVTGAVLQLVSATGTPLTGFQVDAISNAAALVLRRANGTGTTAVANNDPMGAVTVRGYDGGAYSAAAASIGVYASGAWTGTAHGTTVDISTTASGTTSLASQATFGLGVQIGTPTPPGIAMVTGDLNVQNRIMINGLSIVAQSPQYQVAYYDTTGSVNRVAGHSLITTNPAGNLFVNGVSVGADTTATLAASAVNPAITTQFVVVTPVAAGHGVTLPTAPASGGTHQIVRNSGANTLNVLPISTAQINNLGNGVAITVLPNSTAYFESQNATQWFTVP